MKKFTIQFVLLIIVIFLALLFYTNRIPNIPFVTQSPPYHQLTINDAKIKVEIADTPQRRKKGLGGRESLASDWGMLFVFEKADRYTFWMKGLHFPLDFIWIKGDKIVEITENIPAPEQGAKDEQLPIYQSKEPIDKVLEVNAGFVKAKNIKIGDRYTLTK